MKKVLPLLLIPFIFASCSKSPEVKQTVKNGDTITVDYTGRLEDGTIFDSSRQEDAKKSKNYNASRTYAPLTFTVGAKQMIPGFDAGVIGMQVGEQKTLTLQPKDAYGEATIEQTLPKQVFEDTITQELPLTNFRDTISQEVPLSALGDQAKTIKVGSTLNAGGLTSVVKAINDKTVTLEINNTLNPFYKKTLKVGLKGEFDGNTITIKKLTDTTATVEIINKQNPFYGKTIEKGLSGSLPNGQKITIKAIQGDQVVVETPNTNELAGKTLIFDVKIVSIKSAAETVSGEATAN